MKRAVHRSKRQIEELVAELAPRPDEPALMRKLPVRVSAEPPPTLELRPDAVAASAVRLPSDSRAASAPGLAAAVSGKTIELRPDGVTSSAPDHGCGPPGRAKHPGSVEPLAPGRYKVQFTASAALQNKLERLRALMRASVPDGNLAAIIEQAVSEKLERLEARRFARAKRPRQALPGTDPGSRYIPAAVRRTVHERDQGRCRYVDEQGHRCTARDRLEFHHRRPFAHGGDCGAENIQLLCRSHNQYLAEADYGTEATARHRRSPGRVSEASAVYSIRASRSWRFVAASLARCHST